MKIIRGLAAAVLLAAASPCRIWSDPGVTKNEIVIGSCSALSGLQKEFGSVYLAGANAYLNYVNKEQGGVYGRRIRLISYDDAYEPDKAIECFNRLIGDGIFAAAFFTGTPTSAKYVPMTEKTKIPMIGLTTGAQFIYEPLNRYVFNARASYEDETREGVRHLWEDLGVRKIGVIIQNDALGASGMKGIKQTLGRYHSAPIVQGSFERNSLDVEQAVQTVRAAKPEAVIHVAPYAQSATILKKGRSEGWNPLTLIIAGRDSLIKAAGKASEGLIWALTVPSPDQQDLSTVALYNKLLRKYSPKAQPDYKSLDSFVNAMLLVEGLKRAGRDPTREKLVKALESIHDYDIGLGPDFKVNFSQKSHKGFDKFVFVVVRNGKTVVLNDWKKLKRSR